MRTLNLTEMQQVAGGTPTLAEATTAGTGFGAGIGASVVLDMAGGVSMSSLAGIAATAGATTAITVAGATIGGVVAAGWIGVQIGNFLNDNVMPTLSQAASDAWHGLTTDHTDYGAQVMCPYTPGGSSSNSELQEQLELLGE